MNEATQTAKEPTAPLYPLDQPEISVEIKAGNAVLGHKLTRPTLAQLVEREGQIHYESESISDSEERINSDDEAANARLWDGCAVMVRGYRLGKADATPLAEWREVTPELKAAIPSAHKATAIRALYQSACEIEKDEDEGFTLGADEWTVKQIFGDPENPQFVIRHILRTPTESERREFKRRPAQISFSKGSRRQKTRVTTNLKAHVELYDGLLQMIEGATIGGKAWSEIGNARIADIAEGKSKSPRLSEFDAVIDPIWKRQVIDCLMRSFEASTQD